MNEPSSKKGEPKPAVLKALAAELAAIRDDLIAREADVGQLLEAVHADNLHSARNLVHYIALRRNDIRDLQQRLSSVGLSSLSGCEPHVLATIDSIIGMLNLAGGDSGRDSMDC